MSHMTIVSTTRWGRKPCKSPAWEALSHAPVQAATTHYDVGSVMAGKHRRVVAAPGFRGRTAPVVIAPHRSLPIEVTDGPTNVTHYVTEEEMADGRRAGGRYRAICGTRVLSASLATPVRRRCPTCAMWASS
ncbi:MAG: hypothetical protein QOK12_589 [Mycobacterium sp.]|nr:hypothetical protein [Mycobacterium sp.]